MEGGVKGRRLERGGVGGLWGRAGTGSGGSSAAVTGPAGNTCSDTVFLTEASAAPLGNTVHILFHYGNKTITVKLVKVRTMFVVKQLCFVVFVVVSRQSLHVGEVLSTGRAVYAIWQIMGQAVIPQQLRR